MKPPSKKRIVEWVLDAWSHLFKKNIIKLFKYCGLNFANDGTEDEFHHCLRKRQSCKAGTEKLNSQLSILIDKSDVVNPFIISFNEEDANEEMNVIEDETDEKIIL